jgi:hypothetical protein
MRTKLRYANPSLIFKNRPSHRYDVLKDGAYDVKWDQLIFPEPTTIRQQNLHM